MAKVPKKSNHGAMTQMAKNLDDLAAFEEFRHTILPVLQKDLASGMKADDLRKKYEAVAVAKMITMLTRADSDSAAVAAAKDLQDRVSGKPRETKSIEHRLGKLSDQELDAMLLSEASTLEADEE
jgi:hypothetical protein